MMVTGRRYKTPTCFLLLLLLLELLLLTVSAVASNNYETNLRATLPAAYVTRTISDVPSICKCRQICTLDGQCTAFSFDRLETGTSNCLISNERVEVDDLIQSAFAMTLIKTDILGQSTSTGKTATEAAPAAIAAITNSSSITDPASQTPQTTDITTVTTETAMPTTSTTESSTTSTTMLTTSTSTTAFATTSVAASTSSSTAAASTTSTTTSTTTTTTTTVGQVEIFLTSTTTIDGSIANQERKCEEEGGVTAFVNSWEKLDETKNKIKAKSAQWVWVTLQKIDGDIVWPNGVLFSDTAISTSNFIVYDSNGKCYNLYGTGAFELVFCTLKSYPMLVACERTVSP